MRRDWLKITIVAVLLICIAAPIVEWFDTWDQLVPGGGDIEFNVVAIALCIGVVLSLVALARAMVVAAEFPVAAVMISAAAVCREDRGSIYRDVFGAVAVLRI